jgi:hypothetical protein
VGSTIIGTSKAYTVTDKFLKIKEWRLFGLCNFNCDTICISKRLKQDLLIDTFCHEWGHVFLGNLGHCEKHTLLKNKLKRSLQCPK